MILPKARTRLARAALASVCALALLAAAGGPPGPAAAQEAASAVQDVTLTDVALPLGATVLTAPRATVSGTRLSKDELMAILRADSAEPWPTRLARLEAASITIPVLVSEHAGPGDARQSVTYREVTARDVRGGRIAELTSSGAAISVAGSPSKGSGTYGRIQATELDLAALTRLYTVSGDGKGAVQRVYAGVTVTDVVYTDESGTTVKLAALDGRDLGGRPVPGGWGGALDLVTANLGAADSDTEMNPAERARLAGAAADLAEAVSVGSLEARGLSLSDTDSDGPLLIEIGRIAYSASGTEAGTTLESLALSQGGLRARLARLSIAGFSLAPTIATLRKLAKPEAEVQDEDLRRLAPTIGALTLQELSLDLPAGDAPKTKDGAKDNAKDNAKSGDPLLAGSPAAPVHIALHDAAISFGPSRDGVPTASRLSLSGLTLPASAVAGMPLLEALPAYGYKDLDLNLVADAAWDEAKREIALREVSVSGRDMGTLRLAGTLGGFGPEVFSGTMPDASLLLFTATAKAFDLTVENTGLFERFLGVQSKMLSLKPDELRREYVTASQVGVPVILGNSPAARALGAAVGQFVIKPGRLVVTARAKNATGLGFADFSAARSPAAVLDKLDLDAKAD